MDSNKVEPKAYKGAPGSRYTAHVWPWSTAPQPDGLDRESILRREETGVPGEDPRSQVEIDWNSIHIQHVVEVEGVIDVHYASLASPRVQQYHA